MSDIVVADLKRTALVTSALVFLAMNFMPLGPTTGLDKVSASEPHRQWGHRSFLNTMEQLPLILAALWTHAIFVSVETATTLGWVYVFFRACYPMVWLVCGGANGMPKAPYTWVLFGEKMSIYYVTYPQYGIIMYMIFANFLSLLLDFDLNALVVMPAIVAPLGFGLCLFHYSLGLVPIAQNMLKPFFAGSTGMV
jgi:hypothetical protein